jgi:2-iminobutanoate/2-iminopropanoate deaminase
MSAQSRREVRVGGLHEPISHYTDGVICGNLVFVSGCVAVDGRGDLIGGDDSAAQTRQVLENLTAILSAAGTSLANVLKMTVYLTDINDRPKINPVRQEFFGEVRPASTLIEISRLAIPGAKVEIDVVACIP